METMGRKKARPRRSFSKAFKAEVVELVRTSGKSIGEVSGTLPDRDGRAGVGAPSRRG